MGDVQRGHGQLAGTPTAATTFSNIVIRVSDGEATAALPAFAIVVAPISTGLPGSVTVSWLPPTTERRRHGGRLAWRVIASDTARAPAALSTVVTVPNAGVVNSLIEGLAPGVWYFTVTAFTSEGAESDDSAVVSANIT